MKKRVWSVALSALILFLVPASLASAATVNANQVIVISDSLPVYASPNTASEVLGTASNGEILEILSEQANWYQVSMWDTASNTRQQGYVVKSFVVDDAEFITARNETLVYALPSTSAKTVGILKAGEELTVIGEADDFWAVNLRTAGGFVRKTDVDYSGPVATPAPTRRPTAAPTAQPTAALMTYVVVRDTNIYSAPSMNAHSSGVMVAGSIVTIGSIQNGFGQDVNTNLWLPMSNLQIPNPWNPPVIETSTPEVRYFVNNDGTSVYAEPSLGADVVDTLSANTIVVVGNVSNGFGQVTYFGSKGWIPLDQLTQMSRDLPGA